MIGDRNCPDTDRWQRLAAGQADDAESGALEEHLLQCAACLQVFKAMPATDPIVKALRQPATVPPASDSDTAKLLQTLKALLPADAATTTDAATSQGAVAPRSLAEARALLAPAQRPDEIGRLGDYRILGVLGAGGMGVVYRAEDPRLERIVAVKTLLPALAAHAAARERFVREARSAARLKHDHVVTIHHAGEADGVAFLVMEFLEGESLEERLRREAPLPIAEAVPIAGAIAEGLAAAHQLGLVHRDIKPANIWLERPGDGTGQPTTPEGERSEPSGFADSPRSLSRTRVKILDFGLARATDGDVSVTQSGAMVGTPQYMSPEQAEDGMVDARSDLFSLGCVLYRMCTGVVPFAGRTTTNVLLALTTESPKPPDQLNPQVPPALTALILRLLAKDPARRPASAAEVAQALRRLPPAPADTIAFDRATIDTSAAPQPAARKTARRRGVWIAGGMAGVLVLALVAVAAYRSRRNASNAAAVHPGAPALSGYVDVMVVRQVAGKPHYLALSHSEALPLRLGADYVRIEARLNRPAFMYIVWVDTEGAVDLVYPWDDAKKCRPPDEQPTDHRFWIDETTGGFLNAGPAGTATLLLLARDEKLPDDVDIPRLFGKLGPQKAFQRREAAWFENGELVKNDARFAAINFAADRGLGGAKVVVIDDPVMGVQALWRSTLKPHFTYSRGVCFSCEPGP